jgi:hypothetical protein
MTGDHLGAGRGGPISRGKNGRPGATGPDLRGDEYSSPFVPFGLTDSWARLRRSSIRAACGSDLPRVRPQPSTRRVARSCPCAPSVFSWWCASPSPGAGKSIVFATCSCTPGKRSVSRARCRTLRSFSTDRTDAFRCRSAMSRSSVCRTSRCVCWAWHTIGGRSRGRHAVNERDAGDSLWCIPRQIDCHESSPLVPIHAWKTGHCVCARVHRRTCSPVLRICSKEAPAGQVVRAGILARQNLRRVQQALASTRFGNAPSSACPRPRSPFERRTTPTSAQLMATPEARRDEPTMS